MSTDILPPVPHIEYTLTKSAVRLCLWYEVIERAVVAGWLCCLKGAAAVRRIASYSESAFPYPGLPLYRHVRLSG